MCSLLLINMRLSCHVHYRFILTFTLHEISTCEHCKLTRPQSLQKVQNENAPSPAIVKSSAGPLEWYVMAMSARTPQPIGWIENPIATIITVRSATLESGRCYSIFAFLRTRVWLTESWLWSLPNERQSPLPFNESRLRSSMSRGRRCSAQRTSNVGYRIAHDAMAFAQ